jgi:ABC-type sugar transport system substrate-binding protein
MKKIWTVLLICIVSLNAFSCIKTNEIQRIEVPADGIRIVFVTPLSDHNIWDSAKDGFMQAANDLSFGPEYVGPTFISPKNMSDDIYEAIASKADGIITMPIDPELMKDAFEACNGAGIPLIFIASNYDGCESVAFVGTDEKKLGTIGATVIMEKFDGAPIRAVMMNSTNEAPFAINSLSGYLEGFEVYNDFEVVAKESCNSDMVEAIQKYQHIFEENPDTNLVVSLCGEAGPAAAEVAANMGLEDQITIMAIDDTDDIKQLIQEDRLWGTMAQNFYQMGYMSAEIMTQYIRENKKPENYYNDTGSVFVNKQNLSSYMDEFKQIE